MLSSLTACYNNQPFLHQSVMCDRKWILYDSRWWPAQWLNGEEVPKHFPEPNLHQKKVIITAGGLLLVWCTIAFWIPAKALHLRSMLSRVMRVTENCSSCGRRWTTEGAQAFRTKTPSWRHPASRIWTSCASFATFTWPLVNQLPLVKASLQLFVGKTLSQPAGSRKCFPRVLQMLKHRFLLYGNKQTYFSLAKMCLL